MVSPDIQLQVVVFCHSLFYGVLLVFFYDLIRAFRRTVPHGIFWLSVEDLLFWCACGFVIFGMLYRTNAGTVRGFVLLGLLSGILAYHTVCSRIVVRGVTAAFKMIKRGVCMVMLPLKKAGKQLQKSIQKVGKKN